MASFHYTRKKRIYGPRLDLREHPFGRLIAKRYVGNSRWECLCKCGRFTTVETAKLKNGDTTSCGCLEHFNPRRKPIHGLSQHPIYTRWESMIARCYAPTCCNFPRYGGRGIAVCERWRHSVANFYADMGDPPPGLSLERRDNMAGYSPENCYWATPKQQQNNTRYNRLVTYDGETHSMTFWIEKLNLKRSTVYSRLARGWTIEKALTSPPISKANSLKRVSQ